MISITFSPKSLQDLKDIGDYIAKDSRTNARRFINKLIEQCQRIRNSPLAYPRRENLVPGLRIASIGHYTIFFQLSGNEVRIERVLHGARDMTALFVQEEQENLE